MVINLKELIGSRVAEVRKINNLNQYDFSKRIGISQAFLSEVEKGKKNASIELLYGIATAFGIDLNYIIYGEENNVNQEIIAKEMIDALKINDTQVNYRKNNYEVDMWKKEVEKLREENAKLKKTLEKITKIITAETTGGQKDNENS